MYLIRIHSKYLYFMQKAILIFYYLTQIICVASAQPGLPIENFVKADKPVKLLNHNEVMQEIGYPDYAKKEKASGEVVLRVEFDEKGNYVQHTVKKLAHPLLLKAVEAKIAQIKATPAKLDGKPIHFTLTVPFKFNLMGADPIEVLNFEEVRAKIGYPEKAKKKGITGTVAVGVIADTEGNVTDFKVLSSPDKSLTQAVEKYIKELKFKKMQKDGVPATLKTTVKIEF